MEIDVAGYCEYRMLLDGAITPHIAMCIDDIQGRCSVHCWEHHGEGGCKHSGRSGSLAGEQLQANKPWLDKVVW